MGDSVFTFIETPISLSIKPLNYTNITRFGREIFIFHNPGGLINALIRPKEYENLNEANERVNFIIKVKHSLIPVSINDYRL